MPSLLTVRRQVVGVVTAAFVLMCNDSCACAGWFATMDAPFASQERSICKSNCHAGEEREAGGSRPASPTHHRNPSCRHCSPSVTVETAAAMKIGEQEPNWSAAPSVASLWFTHALTSACRRLPVLGDLPPPQNRTSLLSLHCALKS